MPIGRSEMYSGRNMHFLECRELVAATICLISAVVFAATVTAAAAPLRPASVTFAFFHNAVDPLFASDAVQLYAGLKAAEKEINDADLLHGVVLNISFYPALSLASSPSDQRERADAAVSDGVFGFVAADWSSSAAVYAAAAGTAAGTLPVVATRSLTIDEFANSATAFINSYRPPVTMQYLALLRHATGWETAHYSNFAVLTRSVFPNVIDEVRLTLARLGYEPPLHIDLGSGLSPVDVGSVLDRWFSAKRYAPLCALFFAFPEDVVEVIGGLYTDSRFRFSAMSFYAADVAATPEIRHPALGTAPFSRLYLATSVPDPQGSLRAATAYRDAMRLWSATQHSLPDTLQAANVSVDATPNSVSFEGYLAGRLLGAVLETMPSLTAASWHERVYKSSYFFVEDLRLGPYVNRTLSNPELPMPPLCNVGARAMYIQSVSAGRVVFPDTDSVGRQFLRTTVEEDHCFPHEDDISFPVHIQLYAPILVGPRGQRAATQLYNTARLWSLHANDGGSLTNMIVTLAYMNSIIYYNASESPQQQLTRLHIQRRPFVIFGNWWHTDDVAVDVLNIHFSSDSYVTDRPLQEAHAYTKNTWYLKPTLADLAHALAMFLQREFTNHSNPRVVVCGSEDLAIDLAVKSLHTVQLHAEVVPPFNLSHDDAALRQQIESGLSYAASGSNVVVFFATLDVDSVLSILRVAAEVAAVVQQSSTAAATFEHFHVAIATDLEYLYAAKYDELLINGSLLMQFPIFFSSYLYPHFEAANEQRIRLRGVLNSTDSATLDLVSTHTAVALMDLITVALASIDHSTPTPSALLDYLYAKGASNANGVLIGPFDTHDCDADTVARSPVTRHCQCFKAIRTLHVYDFRGWLSADAVFNPDFTYTQTTCGPLYQPLLLASAINIGLIVGVVVPCASIFLLGTAYVACCFGRRNNRHAPKNALEPFAMVFTDIQSSTSLWARAPDDMGEALEQHHAMLRHLVTAHSGYEVKTIGDSFMVAFKRASDAASFALRIQTALFEASWPPSIDEVYTALAQEAWEEKLEADAQKDGDGVPSMHAVPSYAPHCNANYKQSWNGIRVRVGMHWGVGSIKQDPVSQGYDYYGTLVNTAARVEGVGNGGQVLATKDMFDQIEAEQFDLSCVDVLPLGPQPLRGLEQPVPLYQLCPRALAARKFNALRLDVEVDLDDSSSSAPVLSDESGTVITVVNDAPELYLERLLKRQRANAQLAEHLQRVVIFLQTALRTSPLGWQRDTVKTLMKHWHVKHRQPVDKNEAADKTLLYDIAALTARVGPAAEEACRANNLLMRSVRSGGSDDNRVFDFRRPSSLRRKSSMETANVADIS